MPAPLAGPLFTELEERLSDMPRKQQVLARTILETPELVALGSVRDLADQLGMNSATIIRFAKGLGFSGYQGLQAAVREAYLARTGARASRAPLSDGASGVVGEAIARVRANLDVAWAEAESPALDAVAEVVLTSSRVVICTTGSAAVPGLALSRLLLYSGVRAELVDSPGIDRIIRLNHVTPDDVVVVIGLWLAYDDALQALEMATDRGATTVAIVGSHASPLARAADHCLVAPAQGANLPLSVTATVALVEVLASAVAGRRTDHAGETERTLHERYELEGLLAKGYLERRRRD